MSLESEILATLSSLDKSIKFFFNSNLNNLYGFNINPSVNHLVNLYLSDWKTKKPEISDEFVKLGSGYLNLIDDINLSKGFSFARDNYNNLKEQLSSLKDKYPE